MLYKYEFSAKISHFSKFIWYTYVKRKVVYQMENDNVEYCKCENSKGVYSEINDFGWWYHCCECNKVVEDSFHYHSEELDLDDF